MERVILGIILLVGSAAGQSISQTPNRNMQLDKDGNVATPNSIACPAAGCTAIVSSGTGTVSSVGSPVSSAPSNEVVMKALEYGKSYTGKAVDVQIFPYHEEAGGILLGITPKVSADWAIIETLYRETTRMNGRDMRLFRTKTQVLHVANFGSHAAWLSDPIPLKLEDIEKINVRLVTESNVVEFWSDTSEIKRPVGTQK